MSRMRHALWLLLPALAVAAWFGAVRDQVTPRNFGIVEEGKVYRSAALTPAATAKVQREHHIRTIIDLGGYDKDPVGERVAQRTADALGIRRFVFPLEGDGTGDPNSYVKALRVLGDPANHPVLIHCSAGSQRTSGCVMLYREQFQQAPLDRSYPESFQYKHDPAKNPRLMPYLKKWEGPILESYRTGAPIPPADYAPGR